MGLNQTPELYSTSPMRCYRIIPHPGSALSLLDAGHKVLEGERAALGAGLSWPGRSAGLTTACCCWRANVCLGADVAIRKQLQNCCPDPTTSQPLLLGGAGWAAAHGSGMLPARGLSCFCLWASPGYCRSSELPQLLILPGCAIVLVGVSVFAAFTLEHPNGIVFPQLWLCLILVYLKFQFFPSFLSPGSQFFH